MEGSFLDGRYPKCLHVNLHLHSAFKWNGRSTLQQSTIKNIRKHTWNYRVFHDECQKWNTPFLKHTLTQQAVLLRGDLALRRIWFFYSASAAVAASPAVAECRPERRSNHFPFPFLASLHAAGELQCEPLNWVVCAADSVSWCFELKSNANQKNKIKYIQSCSRSLHVSFYHSEAYNYWTKKKSKPCNNAITPPHPWEIWVQCPPMGVLESLSVFLNPTGWLSHSPWGSRIPSPCTCWWFWENDHILGIYRLYQGTLVTGVDFGNMTTY